MYTFFGQIGMWGGEWGPGFMNWGAAGIIWAPIMILLVAWTVYWKYQAIWYAVKHEEKWWFMAFLVINTLGILEILYLHVFSKKMPSHDDKKVPMVPPQS